MTTVDERPTTDTTVQPNLCVVDEKQEAPDGWQVLAADLAGIALDLGALAGSGLPVPNHFELNVQPGADLDDETKVRCIDAMSQMLLGRDGEPRPMGGGETFYTAKGVRSLVGINLYNRVSSAWAERRQAESEKAELRAALAAVEADAAKLRAQLAERGIPECKPECNAPDVNGVRTHFLGCPNEPVVALPSDEFLVTTRRYDAAFGVEKDRLREAARIEALVENARYDHQLAGSEIGEGYGRANCKCRYAAIGETYEVALRMVNEHIEHEVALAEALAATAVDKPIQILAIAPTPDGGMVVATDRPLPTVDSLAVERPTCQHAWHGAGTCGAPVELVNGFWRHVEDTQFDHLATRRTTQ